MFTQTSPYSHPQTNNLGLPKKVKHSIDFETRVEQLWVHEGLSDKSNNFNANFTKIKIMSNEYDHGKRFINLGSKQHRHHDSQNYFDF